MVSETIIHFPGYNLFFHEFHEMAVAYDNEDFALSAEHAEHINERHVDREKAPRANKFYRKFNLTATLGLLTRKTWEERDDFVIIESGFKMGHGEYFMYLFEMGRILVPIRGHMRVERFVSTTRIIQKSLTSSELSPRIPFRGGITTF